MTTGVPEIARMSIGAFSRASAISVRTLRDHHRSGLLVPAVVDPVTGYRSYSVDQLTDAQVIVRLRSLQVPLAQVREILRRRDPSFTAQALAEHRAVVDAARLDAERIVRLLDSDLSVVTTPVHVVTVAPRPVLRCTALVATEDVWDWVAGAAARLLALAGDAVDTSSPPGALYGPELRDEERETVTAIVPLCPPVDPPAIAGVELATLPAATVAVAGHTDGFDTIAETYRALGAWMARHAAAHETAPVREWYHPLHLDPARRREAIEVHWPLADASVTAGVG